MPLLACSDGSDFQFGILIQKKNIFVHTDGTMPSGSEVTQLISTYHPQDISASYGERQYKTFAAVLAPDAVEPAGLMRIPYRSLFVTGPAEYAAVAARAALLLDWLRLT